MIRSMFCRFVFSIGCCLCMAFACTSEAAEPESHFDVQLRSRQMDEQGRLQVTVDPQQWDASETAVIVCDMWDSHHCLNAVRRVGELVPPMNRFLQQARSQGATIIHAPSSCTGFYEEHPARKHVATIPRAETLPVEIETWCHWKNDTEESTGYPIDHSDGGEDDDLEEHARWAAQLEAQGRDPRQPWQRQVAGLDIEPEDFITDDGVENWSILEYRGIKNVMLVGVHTNMCVLGRPFGLRQLARNGKNVVLVRDLTDTMYNPAMPPYVSHFSGTDLIIEHVERYVCPTIASPQLLGGSEHRFRRDQRPHVVMLIGEKEYQTAETLPRFARDHLIRDMKVTIVTAGSDGNEFPGIEAVSDADLLLVSVRRRALPTKQLQIVRDFVQSGKPVVGIRTASHAFSINREPTAGHDVWDTFDQDVFGGNYQGHHGNSEPTSVWFAKSDADEQPWNLGLFAKPTRSGGSLYKTSPLAVGTQVLMWGKIDDAEPEPTAWTFIHRYAGRSFYTSLGHPDDFANPEFNTLLRAGLEWALADQKTRPGQPPALSLK